MQEVWRQLSFDQICGSDGSLRWNKRCSRFVPRDTSFNPSRCEVVPLPEADAKRFIESAHYSRSYPAARFRCGIMVKPAFGAEYLGGVAVFSVPMQGRVITKYLGVGVENQGVELGRLVLQDTPELGFNAETFFLSRSFKLLRRAIPSLEGVVSFADPLPRYAEDGITVVKPGHAGVCYRAFSGAYKGRSSKRKLIVSRSGQVVSERALSKIRNGESGEQYASKQLITMGAPVRAPFEDGRDYVDRALLEGGFNRVAQPGNYVFSWNFARR